MSNHLGLIFPTQFTYYWELHSQEEIKNHFMLGYLGRNIQDETVASQARSSIERAERQKAT